MMEKCSLVLDKNKSLNEVSRTENLAQNNRLRSRSVNEKTPTISEKISPSNCRLTSDSLNWSSNKFSESSKTPRTSRRKKCSLSPLRTSESRRSLFKNDETNENLEIDFSGIVPLSPMSMSNNPKILRSSIKKPFVENNTRNITGSPKKKRMERRSTGTEELRELFHNVNIRTVDRNRLCLDQEAFSLNKNIRSKRQKCLNHDSKLQNINSEFSTKPRSKVRKMETDSIAELQISPKCFYSIQKDEAKTKETKNSSISLNISPTVLKMVSQSSLVKTYCKTRKTRPQRRNAPNFNRLANKGVSHGIRKNNNKNRQNIKTISEFLKTVKSERLKCLPSKRVSPEKVKQVHSILKTTANSIELARPLVINCENEIFSKFSDSDESEIDDFQDHSIIHTKEDHGVSSNHKKENTNAMKECELASPSKSKKFFKSGHSSFKEIKITENIKLGVSCGKMSLLSEKKKKSKSSNKTFVNEQAIVNDIIKNLDISPKKKESVECRTMDEDFSSPNEITDIFLNHQADNKIENEVSNVSNILIIQEDLDKKFRERIPYRTADANEIERQNLLLDFLITNNICTEKNFEIFIADPDNHKDEADEIINNIVEVVNEDVYPLKENLNLDPYDHFRNQIPYNTTDPIKAKEQGILLDFLIENNICTEENFTIFIKELETRKDEAEKIIESVSSLMQIESVSSEEISKDIDAQLPKQAIASNHEQQALYPIFYSGKKYMPVENKFYRNKKLNKLWRGAFGMDQYQIDAGQKEFGAKQCEKCGLIYTVHEPEEEKLHKEYHDSMYFLKFRGWIDEDVVGRYFEWSNDGRIIRVTSSEHPKKKGRLMELLKIVDKELGFASYILPDTYVAFLAVRKSQFVGVCLVQFLKKANRYVKINGIDCCTEEFFDAKIGISRIWVSPLCRRMGIASKLLLAARSYALVGDIVDTDQVAFSAPTEDGKFFAQKSSKRTDFLLYH